MQKFGTPAPISAVLDVPAGRIQLIADAIELDEAAGARFTAHAGDITVGRLTGSGHE